MKIAILHSNTLGLDNSYSTIFIDKILQLLETLLKLSINYKYSPLKLRGSILAPELIS